MPRRYVAISVFCWLAFAVGLTAAPITYTINFDILNGAPIAPSGQFTYDVGAPLGSQFSNFTVTWRDDTFDLTTTANAPTLMGSGILPNPCFASADSAGVFEALANPSNCAPLSSGWIAQAAAANDEFAWFLIPKSFAPTLFFDDLNVSGSATSIVDSSGSWTVTATPEPSTFGIVMFGLCALWYTTRRHRLGDPKI